MKLCRAAAALQQLCHVLNKMHASKEQLGGRFQVGAPDQRSTGSRALVQRVEVLGTQVRRWLACSLKNAFLVAPAAHIIFYLRQSIMYKIGT
jgi:hypothetical protein